MVQSFPCRYDSPQDARLARQLDAGEAGSFTGAGLFVWVE